MTGPPLATGDLPEVFGRYRIKKRLGKGGMGAVYLAHDTTLDRQVALKVPSIDADQRGEWLQRFYREARAAAAFHHPNLCPVYDVGEIDGQPYLTMAYIEGRTLADWAGRALPARQAAGIVRKIALAVAEAHRHGVLHRDLKPANIMVDQRREPIVMDFGLARRGNTDDARLTQTGAVLGTPAYMPPEQALGQIDAMGPAGDVYSLGVILYQLLCGQPPFDGPMAIVLGLILSAEPPPPSQRHGDLDPAIEAICLKAMAKQIGERYSSMDEFAAALSSYLRAVVQNPPAGVEGSAKPVVPVEAVPPIAILAQPPFVVPPRQVPTAQHAMTADSPAIARETLAVPAADVFDPYREWLQVPADRAEQEQYAALILRLTKFEELVTKAKKAAILSRPLATQIAGKSPARGRKLAYVTQIVNQSANRTAESKPQPTPSPAVRKVAPEELTNSIGMKLKLISAGEFWMGSPESEAGRNNDGRHRVKITKPFYLCVYEVTQEEYERVVGRDPSYFASGGGGADTRRFPVEQVSWEDARQFCAKLSELPEERAAGRGYRLPTEAEWEYACRAGTTTPFSFGGDLNGTEANCDGNHPYGTTVKGPYMERPAEVGSYSANAFGLYDMHGNVCEWCADWYDSAYYANSPSADPTGPAAGSRRVMRGGFWGSIASDCRSSDRSAYDPMYRNFNVGFRVALVAVVSRAE